MKLPTTMIMLRPNGKAISRNRKLPPEENMDFSLISMQFIKLVSSSHGTPSHGPHPIGS